MGDIEDGPSDFKVNFLLKILLFEVRKDGILIKKTN
jgi:hypothetical protein